MKGTRRRITFTIDGYTRVCLTAIAVLLTILIVGLWSSGRMPLGESSATAAPAAGEVRLILPNAPAQRLAIIKAIQTTNGKLDKIAALLKSGEVRVALTEAKDVKKKKVTSDVKKTPEK